MSSVSFAEGPDTVTHGQARFELPIRYNRDDFFTLAYTADAEALRPLMPCDRLHPVVLPRGRAILTITAMNFLDTSLGPFGEMAISVAVVYADRRPRTPLAALMESRHPTFGHLVLHLPVTSLAARDAGRGQWGFTKFVADMKFTLSSQFKKCRLTEQGQEILRMRVPNRGRITPDRRPLVSYTVKDGQLLRTRVENVGLRRQAWLPRDAALQLGDHPIADWLRSLKLSQRPIQSRIFLERVAILPAGEVIETGVRPLAGHIGGDREGEHRAVYST